MIFRRGLNTFEPQLATLAKEPPDGDAWLHEVKFDGYRILARKIGDDVRLHSRRNLDWSGRFPSVRNAVGRLHADVVVLDGEVAAVLPDGRTTFQGLQNSLDGEGHYPFVYFVFDLLQVEDEDLISLPLEERKERLRRLVEASQVDIVRYSDHVVGRGREFFAAARARELEGIVSKRRGTPYRPGRGRDWLKVKCVQRQVFVVSGFTEPTGSRTGLGALLLGYHAAGRLHFAGKVGTGFTQREAEVLRAHLETIEVPRCPYGTTPARSWIGSQPHWVQPVIVAEVEFLEWTDDGRVRAPSFKGIRADVNPGEVQLVR